VKNLSGDDITKMKYIYNLTLNDVLDYLVINHFDKKLDKIRNDKSPF
jgi:hypothetical protein